MKKLLLLYAAFIGIFLAYWALYAAAPELHAEWLQGEDGGVETLTFAAFAAASLTAFCTLRFRRSMPRPALFYIFMTGLFYFLCAGEEISWGQRIIGFETPESIATANEQGEFNLHNLNFENLHPSDMVSWYMKMYGIILPLVLWYWMRRKDAVLRRFLPPPGLIPAFCFPEIVHLLRPLTSRIASHLIRPEAERVVSTQNEEVLEMYWGFCVLLAALSLYAAWKRKAESAAVPRAPENQAAP